MIKDLKEKEHINGAFLLSEKTLGRDRNGKAFLSVTIRDRTGSINARLFEKVEAVAQAAEVGDVVWVKGFVQRFQNRRQVIVAELRRAVEGEYQMPDLVAELGGDPRSHLESILATVETLRNPFVKNLLRETLTDPEITDRILKAPAAKTIHHAYRGGLLEHVRSIVDLMEGLAKHYVFLDRDLLVFGAIYHDLGKVFELDATEGIHYTHAGRLVGHMVIATDMIDRRVRATPEFPPELADVLKHIVLAHHGKLEYGSPKLPMLAEALVVAMIDELDSRVNTLFQFLKAEVQNVTPDEKWSHYHPGFERYFYLDFFRAKMNGPE